jgi:hypothetical protein
MGQMAIFLFMFVFDSGPELIDLGAGKSFSYKGFHIRVPAAAFCTGDHFLSASDRLRGKYSLCA